MCGSHAYTLEALPLHTAAAAPESSVPGARPGDTAMPGQTAMKTVENPSLGEVVVEPMLAHLLVLMERSKKAPVHAFDDPSFRQAPASNTDDPMAIAAHLCDTFGRNAAGSLLKSPLEQMASGLVATAEFAAPFAPEDVIAEATAILSAFYDGLPVPVPSVVFLNSVLECESPFWDPASPIDRKLRRRTRLYGPLYSSYQ